MKETRIETDKYASELERFALTGFEESVISTAKESFMEDGSLHPMMFIGFSIEQGEKIAFAAMPVQDFMKSVETKDKLGEMMKQIGKEMDPLCICMVMEAWMVEGKSGATKEDMLEGPPPSEHPDRIEAIVCTFESENLAKTFMFKIKRNPLSLEESNMTSADAISGRFCNILKDMKKMKYN